MEMNPQSQRYIKHGDLLKLRTKNPELVPLGHTANEVANALCRNTKHLESKKYTTLQKKAVDELEGMAPFDPVTQEPEDYDIMYQYFRIFDKLLFFASLEKYCTLEMSLEYHETALAECISNHGRDGKFNYTPLDVRCTLVIYKSRNREDLVEVFDDYLASLIHEMIHAVLEIYCCICRRKCNQNTENLRGASGHGKAFHNILVNLKDAIPTFLGRNMIFDEGGRSLARELKTRVQRQNIEISDQEIRKWTPKVAKLVGISEYRLVELWGYSLEMVAESYRWLWK